MKRLTILALAAVCLLVSGSCAPIEALLGNEPLPVYDQMLQALEAGEQQLVLKGEFTEDTLKKTYRQIRGERPDLFWLGSSWDGVIETSPVFGKTATLTVAYYGEKQENLRKRERLMEKAQELAELCLAKESLYEQLLSAHDEIIRLCQYDHEAMEAITNDPDSSDVQIASTAYGCLVEGKAVCSGYAAAFDLVLKQLAVPCRRITGEADGDLHEWNLVQVEEQWCHVDLTWDDPTTEDGAPVLRHDYFCIPDEEILRTHLPDNAQVYPDGDFRGFDWYANNGMAVESCQMEAVAESLRAQIAAGHETQFIKFTKDPTVNVYCLVDEEFLSNLQEEVNIRWKSYRINSLVNAVELIPAESQ